MLLEKAILETLAYSDIFDYPLNIDELHRYLVAPATKAQVLQCVSNMVKVGSCDGYYFLAGRREIVDLRKVRAVASVKVHRRAVFYGRILGLLPFVRMVAVTGSLAVMNISKGADIDYMLVTRPERLWTARAFAVTFGRMVRPFGHRVCVNLLVSENALVWPQHDLYSAREMCQMIPIEGMDMYHRLRAANSWTETILPNSPVSAPNPLNSSTEEWTNQIQYLLELTLHGRHGNRLEQWTRKFQMHLITYRFGRGGETNFTADVCQGNFHDHRQLTDECFQARLVSLGLVERAQEFAEFSTTM